MIPTTYGYTTKLFYLSLELVLNVFRLKKLTETDQPLITLILTDPLWPLADIYWHLQTLFDHLLTVTDTYLHFQIYNWHFLTSTDTYWHILTHTDMYWYILTPRNTYRHILKTEDQILQNGSTTTTTTTKTSETKKRSCYERLIR